MVRVLIVEDDDDLRSTISEFLRNGDVSVDIAVDLPDADLLLSTTTYDWVVFEWSLPGGDAFTYVRTRRRSGWSTPVLFLTGPGDDEARLASLPQGDDYLVKPFAVTDLVARMPNVARRAATDALPVLRVGELEIDRGSQEVRRNGVPLTLTRHEFAVLELLAEARGQMVTSAALYTHAWGEQNVTSSNVLNVVLARLRRELGPSARLETVRGGGYRLVVDAYPVTIYLRDESTHRQVEAAVEDLIQAAGLQIIDRDDPVRGSWFRRMRARTRDVANSGLAREAAATAAHALDSRFVLAQDATVTAAMMQNLGPVLEALQPTKEAVIRVGALLIVKVEWTVAVHQLTATQQLQLDHHPQLLTSPPDILAALHLSPNGAVPASAAVEGPLATTPDPVQHMPAPMPSHDAEHPVASDHPDGPTRPT